MSKLNMSASIADEIITSSPSRMSGTPVFSGTRVPVKTMFDYLSAGDSLDVFLEHFPEVRREQAVALLDEIGAEIGERGRN